MSRSGRFFLLCAALCCGSAGAAGTTGTRALQDLHYGDVLFHYYQGDEFGALTRLMAARAQGRAEPHAQDGELLMGGMLLSLGQTRDALTIFERLLQTETRPEPRNRAWLAMARAFFQRGAGNEALSALARIDAVLPPDLEADRQLLKAQILIAQARYDEAAEVLTAWKGSPDWASYAQFNLGVALIRGGKTEQGEALLDRIGTQKLRGDEQLALRDRANTALGYAHLQAEEWESARSALQRVRLEGPSSEPALLGLGWAESGLGRDRQALVPWMELAKRDAGEQAVQEALLAVPYAMVRAGARSGAESGYQAAIEAFDREIQHLERLVASLRATDLVERLLEGEGADKLDAKWRLQQLPQTQESRYLVQLIVADRFQEALRNARDQRYLQRNLADWSQRLAALPPSARSAAYKVRLANLRAAGDQLLIRQKAYLQGLAISELQKHQQRLREYQGEARFGLARLYDRSASGGDEPATEAPR